MMVPALAGYTFGNTGSRQRRVGLIGCGWYGKSALLRLLQVEPVEVAALCDVDSNMLVEAAKIVAGRQKSGNMPKTYSDYRQMLKNEKLDIVQISTPDHWHAMTMIEAAKAGADIYLEKPISVDVVEGQAMLAAAEKYKTIVQVDTQRRSTPHVIEARDKYISTGRLGKIAHVELCSYYHMRSRRGAEPAEIPAGLDYEMWSGPAPMRPFTGQHPRAWRSYMEYCNGIVGDMCIHMFDTARWLLELGWPSTISSFGGIFVDKKSASNITDTQTAVFGYPEDDLSIVWQHRTWGRASDPDYPWSVILYGDKGTLKLSTTAYDFIPQDRNAVAEHGDVVYELEEYPEDKTERGLEKHAAPALRRHWRNFLDSVDSRTQPVANIKEGYISSTCCILANIAQQINRTIAWDPVAGRVIGDDEANALLARPYRSPWKHPEA